MIAHGRQFFGVICTLLVMSACQSTSKIANPDVQATMRNTAGLQPLQSAPLPVRTYQIGDNGKKVAVDGLKCKLRSAQFSADLVTPQRVKLPVFAAGTRFRNNGRPDPLTVRCQGKGLSGTATVSATQGNVRSSQSYQNGNSVTLTSGLDLGLTSSVAWSFPPLSILVE